MNEPNIYPRLIRFEVILANGERRVAEFHRSDKIAELMTSDDLGPFLRDLIGWTPPEADET